MKKSAPFFVKLKYELQVVNLIQLPYLLSFSDLYQIILSMYAHDMKVS